jgi:CRP/FNR family transcriptional regulator
MSGAFKELTPEQLQRVDHHRSELSYRKGEILCKQGSFISNMMFIKTGLVKLYLENGDNPTIISIEKNGYFIGLPSLFVEDVFHYSVEALTDVEVCLVDINTFKELLSENSGFATAIVGYLNNDLVYSYNRMASLTQKHINGRFAELLLYLSNRIYESNPFKTSISRKDMADLIATSHESISRLVKKFKEDEIINHNGHEFEILNKDKLKQISKVG